MINSKTLQIINYAKGNKFFCQPLVDKKMNVFVRLTNDMIFLFVLQEVSFIKSIISIFALYYGSLLRYFSFFSFLLIVTIAKKSYLIKTFYCLMWDGSSNFITWILMDNGTYRLNHAYVMEWKSYKTAIVE